jgi:hypothetical protein
MEQIEMQCYYCKKNIKQGFGVDGDSCKPCADKEAREMAATRRRFAEGEEAPHWQDDPYAESGPGDSF